LTHFPPVYPLVLAGLSALGMNLQRAAVVAGVALFTALLVSIGYVTWRATDSVAASFAAGILIACAPSVVEIYSMAWSEGLFLVLAIWSLALSARYLRRERVPDLVSASVLAALAALTRYAGLVLVGTIALALLLGKPRRRKPLLAEIGTMSLIVATSFGAWMLRNMSLAGNATNRPLALHWIGPLQLSVAISTLYRWAAPLGGLGTRIAAVDVVLLTAVFAFATVWLRRLDNSRLRIGVGGGLGPVLALFAVAYAGFLACSISLFDASIPPDTRILSPVYLALVLLAVSGVEGVATRQASGRIATIASTALLSVAFAQNALASWNWVSQARDQGLGFNRPARRVAVAELGAVAAKSSRVIFTNCPELLYFVTGLRAMPLPTKRSVISHLWNPLFASEVARLRADMSTGAVVLYFPAFQPPYMLTQAELLQLQAEPIAQLSVGIAYRIIRSPNGGPAAAQ
jgi:hypothetical protein